MCVAIHGFITRSGKNDIKDAPVKGADALHDDLRVVDVLGDEARPVANGQDGVLQQGVVLDELQGLVGEVQRARDVLLPHAAVDTLPEHTELLLRNIGKTQMRRGHVSVFALPCKYTGLRFHKKKHRIS